MGDEILDQLEKVVKKKKKTINQKVKGKAGESWFADKLTVLTGNNFKRIFTSGASVGKSNSKMLETLTQGQGEASIGDIQSPENLTTFFIWESKNYGEISLHQVFSKKFSKQISNWLTELEYDIESALFRLKDNVRIPVGFLLMKMTRKGSWIIGNCDYLNKHIGHINLSNFLTFIREPSDKLKRSGYGNKYFMTDFEDFIKDNKDNLFIVDEEKEKKLIEAKKAYDKIMKE